MSLSTTVVETLIVAAGIGQLLLAAGSLSIPHVLNWREKLQLLDPLLRRLFWVYAAYILGTNVALGIVSVAAAGSLLETSALAIAVNLYAFVYWTSRLIIQFAFFRELKPEGRFFVAAETALVALFLFLSATYLTALFFIMGTGAP